MNEEYSKKIELLNKQIENKKKKQSIIKIKSYYEFFRIVRRVYENTKPFTLSVFTFVKNNNLKSINIDFVYQIKSDGGDGTIIFTGEYGQVPITNIDVISQLYQTKINLLIDDISDLDEYDNGLYEFLDKKGIKSMVLINIFNKNVKNSKPIGFFVLTYKDKFITKDEEKFVLEESKKISEHLVNILK
ncbi:MAG: hypothetical protein HPY57_14300 [Ignavibacteria bacterium]|nr:hypothetical protein [Ignavibacteria bacterium]